MIRRSLLKISWIALGVLLLNSCADQLDSIRPKNNISQDMLKDADLDKVVNGIYASMEEFVFNFYLDGDIKGENFMAGPGFALNDPMLMTASTSSILSLWQKSFTTLKQVNFLIETYENNQNKENQTVKTAGGTGYYFRALIYYHMVIRWGGVPILRKRTDNVVPISSENDVWSFILEDLLKADELLLEFSDKYYVSKSANNALLAKTYLSLGNNSEAIKFAEKIISKSDFELSKTSEEYASAFVQNPTSKEIIFALANARNTGLLLLYQNLNDTDATWPYAPSKDCYDNLYSDKPEKTNDIRKQTVFSVTNNQRVIKFPNGQPGQFIANANAAQSPIVVTRLAEIYLIRAEALKNTTEGKQALMSFLEKRYQTVTIPAVMTDFYFQNFILDERHREFYGEGFRWYDIKRTKRLDLFKSLNGRDYLMYFPVPQNERDLAGYENYPQNDGY